MRPALCPARSSEARRARRASAPSAERPRSGCVEQRGNAWTGRQRGERRDAPARRRREDFATRAALIRGVPLVLSDFVSSAGIPEVDGVGGIVVTERRAVYHVGQLRAGATSEDWRREGLPGDAIGARRDKERGCRARAGRLAVEHGPEFLATGNPLHVDVPCGIAGL